MGDQDLTDSHDADQVRHDSIALARLIYLDDAHPHGCAETVFMVLKTACSLDAPSDPSAAIALNGGIGYSGGPCGAITGGALAVGMLAEQRMEDHTAAKLVARELVAGTMEVFRAEHGAIDCRDLIGYDLRAPGQHHAFLESGLWSTRCISQIETVVGHLAPLADQDAWDAAVARIEAEADH